MRILILAAVTVAAVLGVMSCNQRTPARKVPRVEEGFSSFERGIEIFFAGKGPLRFSSPGNDTNTGWSDAGSNRWEFRGVVITTNERIPWRAIVQDHATNWNLISLKLGNRVMK